MRRARILARVRAAQVQVTGMQAEEQQLGMWAPQADGSVRTVNWAGTFDSNALLGDVKGKPQDAIIEQVGPADRNITLAAAAPT